MHATSVLASSLDIREATTCIRWTSVLKLLGAALVALGVVCELVGELAGRAAEQTVETAREAEFVRLAEQVEAMRRVAGRGRAESASSERASGAPLPVGVMLPMRAGRGPACARVRTSAAAASGGPGP